MSSYIKIHKKKLKDSDELVSATSNVLHYLRRNAKPLIFISLVVLILITSWAGLMVYKDKLNKDINREIFLISKEVGSLKEIPAEKIDRLKKLEHKFLAKNIYSSLYIGHFYYKNGKYEDAINEYKKVLESKGSPTMKQNAIIGLVHSYESLGKYKDAINVLLKILNENEKNISNKEEIYISLGRLYEESGDYKSAIEKYQFVVEKFPNIRNIEEIKEKAKNLKSISTL